LPVDRPDGSEVTSRPDNLTKLSTDAQEAITSMRERAAGKTVLIAWRSKDDVFSRYHDIAWTCIARYCSDWFGYQVITSVDSEKDWTADLVITNYEEDWTIAESESLGEERILVVHEHMTSSQHHKGQRPIGKICAPIGPFKLARSILSLLEQELPAKAPKPSNTLDRGTQTPLSSPEDRILNGKQMTDYGFTETLLSPLTTIPDSIEPLASLVSVVAPPPPTPATHDEAAKQAIASLGAMSLHMPSRFKTRTPGVATISKEPALNSVKALGPPPNPTNALHILAVDDNSLNLQLIRRYLLKRKTDTIITARNGVEAVAAFREEANKGRSFDVVFMDISMPEMDGFEAARLIRSFESFAHRSISEEAGCYFRLGEDEERGAEEEQVEGRGVNAPTKTGRSVRAYIVALTGLASRRDREEAESSGFDDFLTKPIAFGKIGELLKRLSEEKEILGKG
jgi:CheY-like chemotaxis protein